jgi:hypothetical protein
MEEFLTLIQQNTNDSIKYFARVIMTNDLEEKTPSWICSANQPFPFIMGPETVTQMRGKSPIEIMEFIGYERSFVKEKLTQGYRFYIVFFSGFYQHAEMVAGISKREPLEATWLNVLSLIKEVSPVCGEKCEMVYGIVQSTNYDQFEYDIERLSPEVYREVCSFEAFASTLLPITPTLIRAFIRHTMKCTRLYSGDGYSYDEKGRRGAKEYLIPRVPISSLVDASEVFLIDIDLS